MATAVLSCPPENPFITQLEARRHRRRLTTSRALVIACEDEVGLAKSPYETDVPGSLCLGTPGASVGDPELCEAVRYAVHELGVEQVVLASHSLCDHLDSEGGPTALTPAPAADGIETRVARFNRLVDAARDCVRSGVGRLEDDLHAAGVDVPVFGMVRAVESGVYFAYDPERDEFEALL